MLKHLKTLAAGIALASFAAVASADWVSTYDPQPDVAIPPSHSWTHDSATVPYSPLR